MSNLDKSTLEELLGKGIIDKNTYASLLGVKETDEHIKGVNLKSAYNSFVLMLRDQHSKNTLDGYTTNVKKFWEDYFDVNFCQIDDSQDIPVITSEYVSNWFHKLASQGYTYTSIRRYKHSMKKFFEYIQNELNLDIIDISNIEIPLTDDAEDDWKDALRDEKIRAMAKYAKQVRDKALILFMYETSMKRGEIINCKKSDINFENNTVNIYNGDKLDRVGTFSEETKALIKDHIDEFESLVWNLNNERKVRGAQQVTISEYLFQTTRENPQISTSTIFKIIKDTAYEYFLNELKNPDTAKAMIEKIYPETLRNSRRAWLFSEGKTLDQVQVIMGDENKWACRRHLKIAQQLYPEKF